MNGFMLHALLDIKRAVHVLGTGINAWFAAVIEASLITVPTTAVSKNSDVDRPYWD